MREWVGRRTCAECQALAAAAGSSSGNSLIDAPDSATVTSSAGAFLAPLACRRAGEWERVGRRCQLCDKRTRTALAPRSGGDFDSEMTTLMRPSLADTMPTFTVIWFSDMMPIEFLLVPMRGGAISGTNGRDVG